MRIAYFTDTYLPEINGVVTAIEAHTRLLAGRGHELLIICPKYRKPILYRVEGITIKRYRSFSFISNKATRIALPSATSVFDALVRFRPDVVHVQTPLTIGVVGLATANALRLPVVQTYHTYIPDFIRYIEPRRLLRLDDLQDRLLNSIVMARGFESGAWQRLVSLRRDHVGAERAQVVKEITEVAESAIGDLPADERTALLKRLAWVFTRNVYNRCDRVLTPSRTLKLELEEHGVTAPVEYLSNGIDLGLMAVKSDYARTGRLLHAGRLGQEKHVEVVVDAFAEIAGRQPDATLDIVGDGPARESLERQVERLGLRGRVRFPGFMERGALASIYRDYDAFVTASTIETQGIVLLESMAAGLPVIGADALAIPELVRDGRDGIVVPPGDVTAFAGAMEQLLGDGELRERYGRACAEDAREHSLDGVVERLEGVYAEVLRQSARA